MTSQKLSWEMKIIDAGFKAVALKAHPDKPGGSNDDMQALGVARERLKFILGRYEEWEESERIKTTMRSRTDAAAAPVSTAGGVRPPAPLTVTQQPSGTGILILDYFIDSFSRNLAARVAPKKHRAHIKSK